MVSDKAIWCTARALAALSCESGRVLERAQAYLGEGNLEKYFLWMRVLGALNKLRPAEVE